MPAPAVSATSTCLTGACGPVQGRGCVDLPAGEAVDWVLANHADELTPWVREASMLLIAAMPCHHARLVPADLSS